MEQRLGDPTLYEPVVRRGIPVIFSHCGTGSFVFPGHDYSREFMEMLERHDNVYGDTSAFCSLVRRNQIRRDKNILPRRSSGLTRRSIPALLPGWRLRAFRRCRRHRDAPLPSALRSSVRVAVLTPL